MDDPIKTGGMLPTAKDGMDDPIKTGGMLPTAKDGMDDPIETGGMLPTAKDGMDDPIETGLPDSETGGIDVTGGVVLTGLADIAVGAPVPV